MCSRKGLVLPKGLTLLAGVALILAKPLNDNRSTLLPGYISDFKMGQPIYTNSTAEWLTHHIPANLTKPKPMHVVRVFKLCLFGVPGVRRGKAGSAERFSNKTRSPAKITQNDIAAREAAENTLRFIVDPAERAGVMVEVYVHAWLSAGSTSSIALAIDSTFSWRLRRSLYEPYRKDKSHHVLSMLESIRMVLQAASPLALDTPFTELVLLMRHDCYWFREVDILGSLSFEPEGVLYTALWCESELLPWCQRIRRHHRNHGMGNATVACAPLVLTEYRGVTDYFMLGTFGHVATFFHDLFARVEANGNHVANERAHFVLEEHAEAMGLIEMGLWQSLPNVITNVDVSLYRMRTFPLSYEGNDGSSKSGDIGRQIGCARSGMGSVCLRRERRGNVG